MTKILKRPLSVLLAVLMIAGIFTALPLTAYAAPTETLLTTITATGKEQASYSTANVATVSFSYLPDCDSAYLATWGWWGYGWTATVTPADGYTITKCVFYDNANHTATDSSSPFEVETTEEEKTPLVNGNVISNSDCKGIKKIEVYGYATPTTYTVTWKNGDTVLETDTDVAKDATPEYNGATPTKAGHYTFTGWSPAVTAVTADATYTAQFREHTITHTPAQAATYEADGNIEYWYCEDCNKYYSDSACTNVITQAQTVVPKLTYNYTTAGGVGYNFNDTITKGEGDTLATLNGYSSLFNFKILGVQKKDNVDALSSESGKDVRFVTVVNSAILKDADEYGYVFAKFNSKEDARAHADEIQAYGDNVLTKECTTTSNNISGNYGLYNEDTNYKYVTATVNGIGDDTVAARFYIKKGSTYYYADYTNDQNQTYGVCAAAYSDLK